MKALFALFLPVVIFFSSCEKTEYVETLVPNRTIIVDIAPSSWRTSDGGKSYITTIGMPEITEGFNERGGVLVYLSFGNRTYEQLPEVYNGVAYSFATSRGQLELELQGSDGAAVVSPPGQIITAKIILIESQF